MSHPPPIFTWRTNTGEEFQLPLTSNELSQFHATTDAHGTTLTIQSARVRDSGVYTLTVQNGVDRKEESFELIVHGIFIDNTKTQVVYQLLNFHLF